MKFSSVESPGRDERRNETRQPFKSFERSCTTAPTFEIKYLRQSSSRQRKLIFSMSANWFSDVVSHKNSFFPSPRFALTFILCLPYFKPIHKRWRRLVLIGSVYEWRRRLSCLIIPTSITRMFVLNSTFHLISVSALMASSKQEGNSSLK